MSRCSVPLQPTYVGFLNSTVDALVLIEACLRGHLNHVPRRPQDRERPELIKSGNIFIYEESASGIKRWTDGVNWSPSRILGNFLIYRELAKPFPPGEKKRALKKQRKGPANGVSKRPSLSPPPARSDTALALVGGGGAPSEGAMTKEMERALVGSLVDSYTFKDKGLIKKTISVSFRGVLHHVVSYYNCDDVISRRLPQPTDTALGQSCVPRQELIGRQTFRAPIEHDSLYGLSPGLSMPGMEPPPMTFTDQPEFSWGGQMPQPFIDGPFQHQPQHQLGNIQYGHGAPQPGLLPFDHAMAQNVTPRNIQYGHGTSQPELMPFDHTMDQNVTAHTMDQSIAAHAMDQNGTHPGSAHLMYRPHLGGGSA
ncbi:uncharacterized protein DNG_01366 [Cephalotrichum gorgonifer]|uniref:Camp independent regulatory protein n=1 Tax=Cephalotrichum gorgonifer TaxID=2041049 RepID=A0AAE8MSX8_9PEZI|nr:uncharacterized protein DNG_01366 [Cephalotrichum gorgonifer]